MEEALFRPDGDLMEHDSGLGTPDSTNIPDNPMILTEERLVYVFSANDKGSLQRQVSALAEYVKERPALIFPQLMRSMAYTLGSRRSAHAWKLAVAATTQDELVQNLKDVALTPIKSTEQPRIGFLFTGQGSQWATMGRSLYCAYPVYASAIRKADETLRNLGASWSLIDELDKAQELSMIDRPYVSQPACTALQIALVDLLSSWGITPKCVSGHSSGEIAAAYAAEILELETCMAIAYYRGVVAMTLKEDPERVPGGMLAVGATQAEAQLLIDESQGANVRIACLNSPSSITLSGDAPGIAQIQELANSKSIWNRRLKIDVAYHSHHMEVVAGKYRRLLGELEPRVHSSIQFFSSLKGTLVESSSLITSYWIENLTCPVLFTSSVQSLCETARPGSKRGVDMLIELGPHAALQGPVRQILQSLEGSCRTIQSLPSLVRNADEVKSITQLSSRLFINGAPIELKNVNFPNARSNYPDILTDLPTYQWNHSKRYWHDCRSSQESRTHSSPRHDLLGNRVSDCNLLEPQWKNVLVADDVPWLRDHRVQEMTVFPLAGYLCMAMEACRQQAQWKDTKYDRIVFREISIFQALTIHDSSPVELRLSFLPFSESTRSSSEIWNQFKIFSWTSEGSWMEHCRGLVGTRLPDQANSVDIQSKNQSSLDKDTEAWRQQMELCSESVDAAKVYRVSAGSGFEFGPSFRQITDVMMGPSETVYTATVPDTASCMPYNYESDYIIHPISLDALFQSALFLLSNGGRDYASPYMPVAVKELTVMTNVIRKPGTTYKLFARCEASDMFSRKRLFDCAAMNSLDDSTSCGVLVKGLTEVPIQRSQIAQDDDKSRCLRVQWEPCMSYLMQSQCKKIFGSDHEDPIDLMTAYMVKLAHQNPSLRVLEIGGVTDVPVTLPILKSLGGTFGAPASFAHYDYTDSVPGFTETSQASLVPWGKLVGHRKLDIGESPVAQGFAPESYDVVIVTDFSLVDSDEDNRLKNVRSLLRAGGKLLLANVASEKTDGSTNVIRDGVDVKTKDSGKGKPHLSPSFIICTLIDHDGAGSIEHKQETASVKDNWNNMLVVNGFSGLDGTYLGNRDAGNVIFSTAVPLASMPDELTPDLVIVSQWLPHGISRNVVEANLNPTNSINVRWIEFSELADENLHRKHCIVIDNPEATFMTSLTAESFQGLKNLPQAAGILWLTGGISSPNGGLVRGFARTIRAEFQIRDFVTLAIDVWDTPTDETVELIGKVYERSLRWTAKDTEFDMELAIIDGTVHVPRFFQDVAMDQSLARETQKGSRDLQPFFQEGRPLKLTIAIPGFLDTLCFVDDDRAAEPLRDDEIEIDIQATGLNFKDVILALGQLAGNHLGQECSGVVTKVGSDVSYIKPGQRVCAIAASTMANIGRCKAYCATPIPDFMSFAQGASIPIIYCTVYYCLARIANLRAGETILIHAAAGGVGQSAIMLAQAMKAKIIATVGSPEKKEFLMQTYNIPEDCIFYSRDTSFLQRVLHTTNGVGVDVALNSLAGEQLRATWQCMARFGRFVEIGKRDITSNMNLEMSRFEHSVSFSAFDLTDLIQFRPHMLQEMFLELMDLFRSGAINTVSPIHEFPASQVEQAFRSLQTGKLMGKLVIVPQRDDMVMVSLVSSLPVAIGQHS